MYTASNALPSVGCFIGNGKLGIINNSSENNVAVKRVYIAKNVEWKNGMYQPNIVQTFCPFGLTITPSTSTSECLIENTVQYLNMDTGIAQNSYNLLHSGSNFGTVKTSIFCARHLPYTSVQTHTIENLQTNTITILHECWTQENIINPVYENSVTYVGSTKPLHMFIGHGQTADGIKLAFACGYLFEDDNNHVKPYGIGTNMTSEKNNYQFNCIEIDNITNGATKFHFVTTFVTSDDFDDPRSEAIRICTNICSPTAYTSTHSGIASFIRAKHVDAWSKLWSTKIRIMPKSDASPEQLLEVKGLNTCLLGALYHIYSSVRENFNGDVNTNALPMIDIDGTMIYEADMWLIPLLLILKPDIARGFIEYRYYSLQTSKQLAASYGAPGSKIPYTDDIIGNRNSLYYNTTSYTHLLNTCMAAINAWNYFRISKDKDWLMRIGFDIIKSIALYLSNIVDYDEVTGSFTLKNVVGLNTKVSESNNNYTNNLVKIVFKYAVEASYETRYESPELWQDIYAGLPLKQYTSTNVFRFDDLSSSSDLYDVLEVLYMFTPGLWDNLDRSNIVNFSNLVKSNFEFYDNTRINAGQENRPLNLALRAINAGLIMNQESSYLPTFMGILADFIRENASSPWKQMKRDYMILNKRQFNNIISINSLTTNALFISIMLQGMLQVRVTGGITNTRYYYEDMRIVNSSYATMPSYWTMVSVTNVGIGNNKKTIDIRQNVYDGQYSQPNIGGAFIANGDFGMFTP